MHRLGTALALALALALPLPAAVPALAATDPAAPAPPPGPPRNLDFEEGEPGQLPPGWALSQQNPEAGFAARLAENAQSGRRCAELGHPGEPESPWAFGALEQAIDAAPYRGKRVRLRAAARAELPAGAQAQLVLRVERASGEVAFAADTARHPIASPAWEIYDAVGDVPPDAATLEIGLLLRIGGTAWLDAVALEVIGPAGAGNEPPRPLGERGLENLVAFTRLLGYVRFFHPSDQAAAADWERLAMAGVERAEPAAGAVELAAALAELFAPIAPALAVFPTGTAPPPLPAAVAAEAAGTNGEPLRLVGWKHHGVHLGSALPQAIYRSERAGAAAGEPFAADLGGGVSISMPLALPAGAGGTLPRPAPGASPPAPGKPEGFVSSADDRTTRLAAVALAWNVFQHFYPYFDVVETDWPGALRAGLSAASTDDGEAAFLRTLRRLVAALHDGHGNVRGPGDPHTHRLPLVWEWVEDRLVVTHADPAAAPGLPRGTVVLAIDGRPPAELLAEAEEQISGATPQWRRHRAVGRLAWGGKDASVRLTVQRPGEPPPAPATVALRHTLDQDAAAALLEPRPEQVAEVRPGIFYLDLSRITDEDFAAALPRLETARGIVFDLRGYPNKVSPVVLAHLTDTPLHSAQWHVPLVTRPDREGMTFEQSGWPVWAQKPRLTAKAAFLTDGRAISYAETYLGIVEAFKLAEIVGGPTAGTNGNVNPFTLPGGYWVSWTGMKVLKHDGSRHHGVGIQPTVPAARTLRGVIEGRDEVLEKGIEVVGGGGIGR